ncbi:uncharacterized protein EAE97_011837 [Botrytis byssoidea]|uniref:GST N-terminal domain-containing protein n=1 Tax=Botrytis byssoidea TaxID=139641 RepID=A0A9P5LJI3_9HELO|nr:uncharacterized protein EAE97_011837 [Botrytis byssoidea]KAF7918742.1 hypothetical protein EAE97_011837 [Botrytis byssoidea]
MEFYTDSTPEAVKNATGLHLITEATPNGKKVQIMLEGLKDEDWFLRLNPKGRIPLLLDNTLTQPFPVMESSAELSYLSDNFNKDNFFGFDNKHEHSEAVQWLFFWQASGQPNQGQNNHFSKSAPEKIPCAISRFKTETLRIYNVLELRLSGHYTAIPRQYLAGAGKGRYSIADIGTWPWVRSWKYAGFTDEEMADFPHLLQWVARIPDRPAVQRGISEFYDSGENSALRVSTRG